MNGLVMSSEVETSPKFSRGATSGFLDSARNDICKMAFKTVPPVIAIPVCSQCRCPVLHRARR